ncbi:transmembrane protein 17B-like [Convolutriloba macropyga]|uniref:transmembrane protein 17B-like n=1 Tax=Convolutriloba macropyga TaxID=536237 RepID=UPI003F5208DC
MQRQTTRVASSGVRGVGVGGGGVGMPQGARQAMVMLTQSMFAYHGKVDPMDKHVTHMSQQMASSTPLQVSLYFNAYFFPFWTCANMVMLALKFDRLSAIYQILLLSCLVFMTVLEVVRLYLGYVGNLQEQVPELAGCWLLTTTLQLPLVIIVLVVPGVDLLPLDCTVNVILLCFVVWQVFTGLFALYFLSRQQVLKFQLQQFYDETTSPEYYNPQSYTNAPHTSATFRNTARAGGTFELEPVYT